MSAERDISRPVLVTLTQRRDFVAASRAHKAVSKGLILQRRVRNDGDAIRVGFTASKKVGNAVLRNRAKRRMRALAREILRDAGAPGCDYVLIARADQTVERPFEKLRGDLLHALERLGPVQK